MKTYFDKNNNKIKEEDFIFVDEIDNPNYPDAYEPFEVEIISYNKAVKILRTCDVK